MRTLNKSGRRSARAHFDRRVHACTDITGFGLLGHASEMAIGSGVTIEIDSKRCRSFRACSTSRRRTSRAAWTPTSEHFGPGIEFGGEVSD